MPCPPTYGDLGKQSRDLFNKGYHFGLMKLECKTKTKNGVGFTIVGNAHQDSGKVCGSLETKYGIKDWCMTVSEKWNTDNTLQTELTLEEGFLTVLPGLKLTLDTSFAPQTGKKTGRVKSSFKRENLSLNVDVDLDGAGPVVHSACVLGKDGELIKNRKKTGRVKSSFKRENLSLNVDVNLDGAGPVVHSACVLGYCGWLVGYQMAVDAPKSKLTKSNFAVGYSTCDFILHTHVNDGVEFGGSIYQKVNENLETGVQLGWTAGGNSTRFGLGWKYTLDKDTSFNAKVNNASQVGLGVTQRLRDGILLTLSAMIDGKNFNQGGHKIGVALELSP